MNTYFIEQFPQNKKQFYPDDSDGQFPKEKTLLTLREYALAVANVLNLSQDNAARVAKIRMCAYKLIIGDRINPGTGEVRFDLLSTGWRCHDRRCPICLWLKSRRQQAQFHAALPHIRAEQRMIQYLAVTLTVRNCAVDELQATTDAMRKAFRLLVERPEMKAALKGWLRVVGIDRSIKGEAHPHFHCIFAVHGFYHFHISPDMWKRVWQECLGVDYLPEVYVSARTNKKTLDEAIRYAFKAPNFKKETAPMLKDPKFFLTLDMQTKNKRTIESGLIIKRSMRMAKEEFNARNRLQTKEQVCDNMRVLVHDMKLRESRYLEGHITLDNIYK